MALPLSPSLDTAPGLLSPEVWPKGTVWHYTTAAGLAGMVLENVLWASSAAFMNDRHELTGDALFRDLFNRHMNEVDPRINGGVQFALESALRTDRYRTFIACASKAPDNLTLWRNYTGPEVGFAVALDASQPLSMRRQRPLTEEMIQRLGYVNEEDNQELRKLAARDIDPFDWREAVYTLEEKKLVAWQAILDVEDAVSSHGEDRKPRKDDLTAMADVAQVIQTFKHEAFKDEQEMRIVCGAPMHADLMYLKHRPGRYGIIPYVELGLPENNSQRLNGGPEPMKKLPVLGVAVGPTPYPDEATAGVRELLRSLGNETIAVIPSQVPFRT